MQLIDVDPSATAALDLLGVPPGLGQPPAALGDRELEALLRWSGGDAAGPPRRRSRIR